MRYTCSVCDGKPHHRSWVQGDIPRSSDVAVRIVSLSCPWCGGRGWVEDKEINDRNLALSSKE